LAESVEQGEVVDIMRTMPLSCFWPGRSVVASGNDGSACVEGPQAARARRGRAKKA
jgi:hypothetical protein